MYRKVLEIVPSPFPSHAATPSYAVPYASSYISDSDSEQLLEVDTLVEIELVEIELEDVEDELSLVELEDTEVELDEDDRLLLTEVEELDMLEDDADEDQLPATSIRRSRFS